MLFHQFKYMCYYCLMFQTLHDATSAEYSTKSIQEMAYEFESDKNSMLAKSSSDEDEHTYEDFYDEAEDRITTRNSMNIIFFGKEKEFLRMDAETILHLISYTKKHLIPLSRAILAWDIVTDGKTAAFLQQREYLAFGTLINFIPEEDLYYVNMGDLEVLKFFAKSPLKLNARKIGILAAAYRRYYGNNWYMNGTYINDLGYLLCGFPPQDIAKIKPDVFKEIHPEVLKRVSKCSSNQLYVLYGIATQDDAYGPPYRWTSHDIDKLSSLFTCIPDHEISSIQLEAMSAIKLEVIKSMEQRKLKFFTKPQVLRMSHETRRMFIIRMQLATSLDMTQLTRKHSNVIEASLLVLVASVMATLLRAEFI